MESAMVTNTPNSQPSQPSAQSAGGDHTETETHGWTIDVPDHPGRTDSPEYVAARRKMNEIAGQAAGLIYGPGPFQDHHGGALWLKDAQGWFMVRNLAGVEWSAQWCADPVKVDVLRQNAKRLYDLLAPEIKQELDPDGLLDTPITDAAGIAKWTDSIFNAGVPLHPAFHTGVLPHGGVQNAAAADPEPGGVHHYPTPIADIQLFKRNDFELWVTDQEGNPAAVAPLAPRGSGDGRVHVLYATPGSQLAAQKRVAEQAGQPLVLSPEHPLAMQAFRNQ
jgi:hypothetical protein